MVTRPHLVTIVGAGLQGKGTIMINSCEVEDNCNKDKTLLFPLNNVPSDTGGGVGGGRGGRDDCLAT